MSGSEQVSSSKAASRVWLRPAGLWLAGFIFVNSLMISLVLPTFVPEVFSPWSRRLAMIWLVRPYDASYDSWTPMAKARAHWRSDSPKPIYTKIFFEDKEKFQYPPSSLLLILPFGAVLDEAKFGEQLIPAMNTVSWPFILVVLVSAALMFLVRYRALNSGVSPPLVWTASVAMMAALYYPLTYAFYLGQAQTILNGLLALMLLTWVLGRERAAGALLGAACLVKPHLGIIYIWGLVRRRWGFVGAATIVGGVGMLVALALFGLDNHLDYMKAVSFMGRHGESYHPNQSVNGLMNRILGTGSAENFYSNAFPAYHPAVHISTVASSLVLVGLCLFWPVKSSQKGGALDVAIALLTTIMASPIAWEHHYGAVVVVYAMLLPIVLKPSSDQRAAAVVLGISFVLTTHQLTFFETLGTQYTIFYSYRFAGGLMLLGLLYALRARPVVEVDEADEADEVNAASAVATAPR